MASIVSGVAEGCVQSGCALIGGETAEHPGMMAAGDYDLAGFSVGIVDKPKVIDNSRMAPGDVILALPSSGIHSNGFSLMRKVFDVEHAALDWHVPELGRTLGEALLEPTVIYVKPVLRCMEAADVKGVSHITGGGFFENIPAASRRDWGQDRQGRRPHPLPSSKCFRSRAIFPNMICSTPSIWAWV